MSLDRERLSQAPPTCIVDADCDDGLGCNGVESCIAGGCAVGQSPCDDGVACTIDLCSEADGCLEHVLDDASCGPGFICDPVRGCSDACTRDIDCDDGRACNGREGCATNGRCFSGDPPCFDGNPCTDETCFENAGGAVCSIGPVNCDDGIDCTHDSCDASLGCIHYPDDLICWDSVDCTLDTCDASLGCQFVPFDGFCDDRIDCTDDVCNTTLGRCVHRLIDRTGTNRCDDGIDCTIDVCVGDWMLTGPGVDTTGCTHITDHSRCVTGFCDVAAGACVTQSCLLADDCSDRNPCNGFEICEPSGMCAPGTPPCPIALMPCSAQFCLPTFSGGGSRCVTISTCGG